MMGLRDVFGYSCPMCGQDEALEIADLCGRRHLVDDDGAVPMDGIIGRENPAANEVEWDDSCDVRCPECGFAATVRDFRQKEDE